MPHFMISAAHKSSGKTTVSIGICAELNRLGYDVRPFKKGPDYIDPIWLSHASGSSCHNLDFYTQSHLEILSDFSSQLYGGDVGVIEGNKGLYDGLDLEGKNSNAALASLIGTPVVLVLDTQGMTRGVAPLLKGYQSFDPSINIAGVILNKVSGARHEQKLKDVIAHYTDIEVIGAVHRSNTLHIVERHLGLIPSNESSSYKSQISVIRDKISKQVDMDRLLSLSQLGKDPEFGNVKDGLQSGKGRKLKVAVAKDEAFGFYYPGDLEAFEREGVELLTFSPLHDRTLPESDGVFIGGGFPEVKMDALEGNHSMRHSIKQFVESGGALYAECGGLMYLSRSVSWKGRRNYMVGLVPADTVMYDRPQGRGYVKLRLKEAFPWDTDVDYSGEIHAHEFHYSRLENLDGDVKFAFDVERGTGIDGMHDGIVYKNMLVNYTHLRHVDACPWAQWFVRHVDRCSRKYR